MLRQDPDVIMIGEIRDEETAHIGIRAAALTGVLVFQHDPRTDRLEHPGQPLRLQDPRLHALQYPAGGDLAAALLRKICPYCRVSFEAEEQHQFSMLGLDPTEYQGPNCPGSGGCRGLQTGLSRPFGDFRDHGGQRHDPQELIFQQIAGDHPPPGRLRHGNARRCGRPRSVKYSEGIHHPGGGLPGRLDVTAAGEGGATAIRGPTRQGGRRCDTERSKGWRIDRRRRPDPL